MLRWAAACALVLLLSGCASPAPAADVQEALVDDDGVLVTATRVEPLAHPVDLSGTIRSHLCSGDEECNRPLTAGGKGLTWAEPQVDAGDPLALFWRVWLLAESPSDPVSTSPRRVLIGGDRFELTLYATTPCGIGCMREREVAAVEGVPGQAVGFDGLEVYLRDGETGIRARFTPLGMPETYAGVGYPYNIQGTLAGYRAVGEPVVVG